MDTINFGQIVGLMVCGSIFGYLIAEWLHDKYDGE